VQELDIQALAAVQETLQDLAMLLHSLGVLLTSVIQAEQCHFRVVHQVGQELHQQPDRLPYRVRRATMAGKARLVLWVQAHGVAAVVLAQSVGIRPQEMVATAVQVQQIQ
jgi:hypothetical protein